jgi:hypothetical protein
MSKRAKDSESKRSRPRTEESAPPLLSDKLIAQLQGAVSAAQRKRTSDPNEASAPAASSHGPIASNRTSAV